MTMTQMQLPEVLKGKTAEPREIWAYIVEADSVEDYLERYYKPERRTPTLLGTYLAEFERDGYVCTSEFDNVTGKYICWPRASKWAEGKTARLFGSQPSALDGDSSPEGQGHDGQRGIA